MADKSLSPEEAKLLLSTKSKTKGIATEPRELRVWFRLDHLIRDTGCSNPNCVDTRPRSDPGRQIVFKLGDEYMCRECFLSGWLSNGSSA